MLETKLKKRVVSEYAYLRHVVVAQSEFIFPNNDIDDESFLDSKTLELYANHDIKGKNYGDVFPERQLQWEQERKNLCTVLEKYGVLIDRPRLLTSFEKNSTGDNGASNFFIRDPFFTIGNHVIESTMHFQHRKLEIFPVRNLLINHALQEDVIYLSAPAPDNSESLFSEVGPFIEGGDVIVLGNTIFVGVSGLASNTAGFNWLKSYLKHFDYTVILVPLRSDVLHLDCALSVVNENLIIVCEEAMTEGLPVYFKDFNRINVPLADVAKLAVNGLPINKSVYIMDPEFDYIAQALREHGITVECIDFKISRSLGGSFRCSTQALHRED